MNEFIELLRAHQIQTLIDIRAYPYSKRFPQFSQQELRDAMNHAGIDYHWAGKQLGGMREAKTPDSHPGLTNDSMRGYAEHMQSPVFEKSIIHLLRLAGKAPTVLMCAEKLFTQCHRSLISDYLVFKNVDVIHILEQQLSAHHQLHNMVRTESAKLVYDRNVTGSLDFH